MGSRSRGDRGARRREKQRRRQEKRRGKKRAPEPVRRVIRSLAAPRPDLCRPPVHVSPGLEPVDDPVQRLGLAPEDTAHPDRVRAAFRRELEAHPPEREPDLARRLREARDRLLDPDRELERRLGVLHVPDPAKYGLPPVEAPAPNAHSATRLPAPARLLGQLALYALLEEEVEGGTREEPGSLPFG